MNQQTLIFLGPQGSGKGTQIDLLKKYLVGKDPSRAIVHFEMGKNLRELGTQNTYAGTHTQEILHTGGIVPYSISATLFAEYLIHNLTTNTEHLLIDGFPRTASQVPMLDSALVDFYKRHSPTVIVITISDEEALKRLLARGRHDDTEKSIRNRLRWSREETMPNIEWFRAHPAYTVIDIDGERAVEEIHRDIVANLGLA